MGDFKIFIDDTIDEDESSFDERTTALWDVLNDFYNIEEVGDFCDRFYKEHLKTETSPDLDLVLHELDKHNDRVYSRFLEEHYSVDDAAGILAGMEADFSTVVKSYQSNPDCIYNLITLKFPDRMAEPQKVQPVSSENIDVSRIYKFFDIRLPSKTKRTILKTNNGSNKTGDPTRTLTLVKSSIGCKTNRIPGYNQPQRNPIIHTPISILITPHFDAITIMSEVNRGRKIPILGSIRDEFVRIYPKTYEDFQNIILTLKLIKAKFFTMTPKADRPVKFIIKGLPTLPEGKSLVDTLNNMGFSCIGCFQFKLKELNKLLPIHCITLLPTKNVMDVLEIKSLYYYKISIFRYKNKVPAQCWNCQQFDHSSETCFLPPACLKCAGTHMTRECQLEPTGKATCSNCGGEHPANYQNCIKNPKNIKKNSKQKSHTI